MLHKQCRMYKKNLETQIMSEEKTIRCMQEGRKPNLTQMRIFSLFQRRVIKSVYRHVLCVGINSIELWSPTTKVGKRYGCPISWNRIMYQKEVTAFHLMTTKLN